MAFLLLLHPWTCRSVGKRNLEIINTTILNIVAVHVNAKITNKSPYGGYIVPERVPSLLHVGEAEMPCIVC